MDACYLDNNDLTGGMDYDILDMSPSAFEAFTQIEPLSTTMNPGFDFFKGVCKCEKIDLLYCNNTVSLVTNLLESTDPRAICHEVTESRQSTWHNPQLRKSYRLAPLILKYVKNPVLRQTWRQDSDLYLSRSEI